MPGNIQASVPIREATIEAVVIRAGGRREELGIISYYHRSRLRRLTWRAQHWIRELFQ